MSFSTSLFTRSGNILPRTLTKLYSDTKQSYASANVTPNLNATDNPEIQSIKRDFQIQQDRLLAWGHDWAESNANEAGRLSGKDVEIDEKLDQAGLGEVVASVLSEIQKLLSNAAQLQQPVKVTTRQRGQGLQRMREEWTGEEVQTAKALLDQTTTCIDVLYNLTDNRRSRSYSSKDSQKKDENTPKDSFSLSTAGRTARGSMHFSHGAAAQAWTTEEDELLVLAKKKGMQWSAISEAYFPEKSGNSCRKRYEILRAKQRSREHPLLQSLQNYHYYIPYADLTFPHLQSDSIAPPPYEETYTSVEDHCLAFYTKTNTNVILSFIDISQAVGPDDTPMIFSERIDKVRQSMGTFKIVQSDMDTTHGPASTFRTGLAGFTVDLDRSRLALVYQSPHLRGRPQTQRSLRNLLNVSSNSPAEQWTPNLEDRFRLAYDVVLSMLHQFRSCLKADLNSDSVIYVCDRTQEHGLLPRPNIRKSIVLPSAHMVLPAGARPTDVHSLMYRHPTDSVSDEQTPAHQLYSIGLVLLEVGLWIPLSKLWKEKYDANAFMHKLKSAYVHRLASKCGSRYLRLVKQCMNASEAAQLSANASDVRQKYASATAILLEVAKELRVCCALDEAGPPPLAELDQFIPQATSNLEDFPRDLGPQVEEDSSMLDAPPTPLSLSDETEIKTSQSEPLPTSPHRATDLVLRKFPHIDIPQSDLDDWNLRLMPRLSKLLQSALAGSPESCSVSLMMVGADEEHAKTTICIQCQNTSKVQKALLRGFRAKRGWGVAIFKGSILKSGRRRRRQPRKQQRKAEQLAMSESGQKLREQYYQTQPSCGASIGAYKNGEHLPPVSFGGTILVDGEPYGMTVHHMLDDVSDEEEDVVPTAPVRSMANRMEAQDDQTMYPELHNGSHLQLEESTDADAHYPSRIELDDEDTISEADSDTSTIRPDYCAFDEDGNEFWFLDNDKEDAPELDSDEGSSESSEPDEEDSASVGDSPGVDPFDEEELQITQPAIDDVDDDFFPCEEDRDEDHLDSHSFGFLHASSGIRRISYPVGGASHKHEVDWALIRVRDERLSVGNSVSQQLSSQTTSSQRRGKGGSKRAKTSRETLDHDLKLKVITPCHELAGTEVYCCGRSSGFKKGRISQAMALVKFHGRQSFSSSWCVEGGFGGEFMKSILSIFTLFIWQRLT